MRPTLSWVSNYSDAAIGNAYGYKIHNDTLKKYVSMIADISEDSGNALMIMSPEYYKEKIPDKVNFLFTMFEGTTIPERYYDSIKKADFIFTPSTWVRELFTKYFDPNTVFVVNHGVEPHFVYKKRKFPRNKKFRYLWVGAPNPRKGYEEIIHCWSKLDWDKNPNVELYIKTTKVGKVETNGNVTVDGRNLSLRELVRVYHDSHCFLFPSRGEGFGLTLAEAMRTGLPCIATQYSGQTDFFDKKVGYPIGYTMNEGVVKFIGDGHEEPTQIAYPNVTEMALNMVEVFTNYNEALKKGVLASKRISTKFTWPIAARRLVNHIEEYGSC